MKIRGSMLPIILPLFSIIGVSSWAVGLGILFILLNETSLGVFGAIIGGLVIIIAVPTIALAVLRMTDSNQKEQS